VGRLPDCHVVIEHPSVSKRHAVLRWDEPSARATLEDVGSKNGTFINGAKQGAGQTGLEDGDTLSFGDVAFSYMLAETLYAKLEQMPTSPAPAPTHGGRRKPLGAVPLQSRLKRMHASTLAGLGSQANAVGEALRLSSSSEPSVPGPETGPTSEPKPPSTDPARKI
jgi:predicted component of type VI protein secretion system